MDRWGLVFAGGGGKGAYEIGAWKALEETGIPFEAVSGTSVGALNAALYAGSSIRNAEELWREDINKKIILTPKDWTEEDIERKLKQKYISDESFHNRLDQWMKRWHILEDIDVVLKVMANLLILQLKYGTFSRAGLISLIEKSGVKEQIKNSAVTCYATCVNLPNKKNKKMSPERFELNGKKGDEISDILLASSAIPVIFPEVKIGEEKYIDGGMPLVGDNVPIKPLVNHGCNKIVVIHLGADVPIILKKSSKLSNVFKATKSGEKIISRTFKGVLTSNSILLPLVAAMGFSASAILSIPIGLLAMGDLAVGASAGLLTEEIVKQCVMEYEKLMTKRYRNVDFYHIYPKMNLGGVLDGTLNFDPNYISQEIDWGYEDTIKYIRKHM